MDKREMIERALGRCLDCGGLNPIARESIIDALAERAIVIECEVEHTTYLKNTLISHSGPPGQLAKMAIPGIHGTPGKAIAIIISSENDEDTRQS